MRPNADDRIESDAVVNARNRLALISESLGTRQPEYASALNQLALLLIMQGDADAAEPLLRESLEVRRTTLGENHPDFATNLSSLGGVLWARGELGEAETLLRQAAEVRCATLGPGHPKSIVSINSLDQLVRAMREWKPVKPLMRAPEMTLAPSDELPSIAAPATTPLPADTITPAPRRGDSPVAAVVATERHFADELEKQFEEVRDDFAALANRLTSAARGLLKDGVVAPEILATECRESRQQFDALHANTLEALRRLSLPFPSEALSGLEGIAALLPTVRDSETSRAGWAALGQKAVGVLERIQRLTCPSTPRFEPLYSCINHALSLHEAISASGVSEPSDEIKSLAAGNHPFSALLVLVEAGESVSDTEWAERFEAVESAFGNPLAVAAARSRLAEAKGLGE